MLPDPESVFSNITPEYLDGLSLTEICDLLSIRTQRLIQEMAQRNPDKNRLRVFRIEVEKIQIAYEKKKGIQILNRP